MNKYTLGLLSILLITSCKKTKSDVSPTNLVLSVTCQCTFDIKVTQRQNTTLQTFNVANLTGVSNNYSVNLEGSTKDLIQVEVRNVSVTPFIVSAVYNGSSIYNHNYLVDNGGDADIYVP